MKPEPEKEDAHSRNKHRFSYDFTALCEALPLLKNFVSRNRFGYDSIDFANPDAVKMLNRALLKYHYGINEWDIPPHYLCPPIPSRAEYIREVADLLGVQNEGEISLRKKISILDIGTGANCVYPIIGHQEYGWQFVGSDIDPIAIASAEKIIQNNPDLHGAVECRLQTSAYHIFKNIILPNEFYDCTVCNPPFHASSAKAKTAAQRKIMNLRTGISDKPILNFGGQNTELWCRGGEIAFIFLMISESEHFKSQVLWFSTLVSKITNVEKIYKRLIKAKVTEIKSIDIEVGNKKSRIIFWTYC
jgi:23S rRNA (adenine1618-N6)-methyltransferase